MNNNNDFADVTLAYEDCQQGEAHKVILAGPLSLIISQSSSHIINISSWQEVAGHPMLSCHIFPLLRYLWALMVLPAWPGIEQIFFYQVAELLESRGEN